MPDAADPAAIRSDLPATDAERIDSPDDDTGKPAPPDAVALSLPDTTVRFWLTRRDRLFVAALAAVTLVLMLVHWVRLSGWGMQPVEVQHLQPRAFNYKIDINAANWIEWAQLDGVGEVLAERIVSEREQNGPFKSVDDLRRVKGIGQKTLEKIRPWLKAGE